MTIGNTESEFPIVTEEQEPFSLHKKSQTWSEKGTAKKVRKARRKRVAGRSTRPFHERIRLLTQVYENGGVWPEKPKLAPSTKRYYRTVFPEFFSSPDDEGAARKRMEQQAKAAQRKAKKPRKSRAKKAVVQEVV